MFKKYEESVISALASGTLANYLAEGKTYISYNVRERRNDYLVVLYRQRSTGLEITLQVDDEAVLVKFPRSEGECHRFSPQECEAIRETLDAMK